jgi:ribonuclease VapC
MQADWFALSNVPKLLALGRVDMLPRSCCDVGEGGLPVHAGSDDVPDQCLERRPVPQAEGMAILEKEPEAERLAHAIGSASRPALSSATLVEVGIVVKARRGEEGARDLDLLLSKLGVDVVAFTARQADIARKAYRNYGRGRHPASLNLGDCYAYAPAKDASEPALCKGNDFRKTDLTLATY